MKEQSPQIRVVVSKEEKEIIKKKADKAGLSVSSYMRNLALKSKV